jgi:DNA helicase II / ATP-dependent DNA helicase PcrA
VAGNSKSAALSPSLARDLELCPYMAKLVDIDRVVTRPPNAAFSLGNSMHAALANFFRAGGPAKLSAEDLVARLHGSWVEAGFSSTEERASYLAEGEYQCRRFHEAWQAEDAVFLEAEVNARESFPFPAFDLVLTGRMDALFERPDGLLEVLDFKTGALRDEESISGDIGVPIYWILAKRAHPAYREVRVSFYYLKNLELVSARPSPGGAAGGKQRLLSLADRLLHGPFDPTPGVACHWCPAKVQCPAQQTPGPASGSRVGA